MTDTIMRMVKTKIRFISRTMLFTGITIAVCGIGLSTAPAMTHALEGDVCAVYFTGVGCPHCAKTDPVILEDLLDRYQNLAVIEYEIYNQQINGPLLYQYDERYGSGLGVPLIIFNEEQNLKGDLPILNDIDSVIQSLGNNPCVLHDGTKADFADLDIANLAAAPKIWHQNRILIKFQEGSSDSQLLRDALTATDLNRVLADQDFTNVEPIAVPLSGKNVAFEYAIALDNWLLEWNGQPPDSDATPVLLAQIIDQQAAAGEQGGSGTTPENNDGSSQDDLTWTKIISLAAVDAVNPCAFAVLVLMLTAILAYNPSKRKNIILAGLAFIASIYVMYLIYGLLIIKFFQIVQALTAVRLWLYKILGVIAVILGVLNIRDFFTYKPGRAGTEMPLFMRPKVKKIIGGITSPTGAFSVGIFVTLFLLPCTIGPYVIAGGILSAMEILQTLPPLLLYNLIFVAPMLIIIAIVYIGFRRVEDISAWKEKHITKLHLVAGLIMFILGIAMITGWV